MPYNSRIKIATYYSQSYAGILGSSLQEIYPTLEAGKQLAHAANIPLTYDYYIYRFLGFDSLFNFPSDTVEAMTYVLKVAGKSREVFEKEDLKKLPCFVIDATELLTVHEPDTLNKLL